MRLSSPTLNYLTIIGAVLMYASVFLYLLPTETKFAVKVRCVVRELSIPSPNLLSYVHTNLKIEYWCFTVGYSVALGAVLVKMWRIYLIFNNPKPNKKVNIAIVF